MTIVAPGPAASLSWRGVRSVARTERRKLAAQLPLRLLAVLCLLGPLIFSVLLKVQSGTPSDALFGTWVHTSGYAISLVVLAFAGNWGFPIIAGVLAGDLFAGEDRQGTWKTVLTRSRSLEEVFLGKVLAAMLFSLVLGIVLAAASVVAGTALVGAHPLVNFAGTELSPPHLLALVTISWSICLPPLLAYTALTVLFSVVARNGIVGVLGPVLVALVTQLLDLIGKGVIVHLLLIGSGFDAWHGLFAHHAYFGPLLVSLLVCVLWITGALTAAWIVLRRRDFIPAADAPRSAWRAPLRIAAIATVLVGALAFASGLGPVGITARRLDTAIGPEFHTLTVLQQRLLGHPIPAGSQYRIVPVCGGRGTTHGGPGDWSCTLNVYIVLPGSPNPVTDTPAGYDVSVQSNGCYKASSPPNALGAAEIQERGGAITVNPLVTIYGCLNIL